MTSSDRPFTDGAETEDVAPELNPELDRAEIADAFRRTGRVHIPDILTDASARRLFRTLERETPWGLIFNEGKKTREFEAVFGRRPSGDGDCRVGTGSHFLPIFLFLLPTAGES